jgi:hypothetical protein
VVGLLNLLRDRARDRMRGSGKRNGESKGGNQSKDFHNQNSLTYHSVVLRCTRSW